MAKVEVFSAPSCGYCVRAKRLLESKGVAYVEIDVAGDPQKQQEMIARSGRYTVPQIFIDGEPIGGCDDLYALNRSGELDVRLGIAAKKSG
ncbi:MAG: glutaredoxin 3 [Pseudomonadota bacterium]